MSLRLLIPSSDEDVIWLFERIVVLLQKDYGHSDAEAVALVNGYCQKFTDPAFCSSYRISVQTPEFFCREESLSMADRIEFYEALGNAPDDEDEAFIKWENQRRP